MAGRPKKVVVDDVEAEVPETIEKVEATKPCPKCGGKVKQPYLDVHGFYRCHCSEPRCGFWDSVVSKTEDEAVRSWELAGGPVKFE